MMKKLVFLIVGITLSVNLNAQIAEWQWAQRAGGSGIGSSGADDEANDIAVDDSGNTYVIGTIYDSFFASFDTTSVKTYGGNDGFIAKYDCEGELKWVKISGSRQSGDQGLAIRVDTTRGVIYASGRINSDNLNPWKLSNDTTITSGHLDFYLAQFEPNGEMNWMFVGESRGTLLGMDIDSLGFIYTLFTVATIPAGPFAPGYNLTTGVYLGKFDSSGNIVFIDSILDSGAASFADIAVDKSGNSYIIGNFQDTAVVSGQQLITKGTADGFILKYDSQGNYQWLKRTNAKANGFYNINGITVLNEDDFYIIGGGLDTAIFGSVVLYGATSGGFGLVIRYNNGSPVWGNHIQSTNISAFASIDHDSKNNIYLGGVAYGNATLGGTSISTSGNTDIFLAQYSSNNIFEYFFTMPGKGSYTDIPNALAVGHNGNVFLAGSFGQDLQLPKDTILSKGGNSDIFVAKYGIPQCTDTTKIPDGIFEFGANGLMTLKLYPNPSNGQFTIETDGIENNSQLLIYNSIGQVIHNERFTQGQQPFRKVLNLDHITGVYFVRLISGEGTYYQKLILE